MKFNKVLLWRSGKLLVVSLSLFGTLILFNNCAGSNFVGTQPEVGSGSTELGSTVQEPVACGTSSGDIAVGSSVSGFVASSALYPGLCGNQVTRTCLASGQFDGSVPVFASCTQNCKHPDTQQPASVGSIYYTYTKTTGATQAECDAAKVTSTCSASTGTFLPAPSAVSKTCLVVGQVCAYTTGAGISNPSGNLMGSTVVGFASATATYPQLCGNQVTRTCQSSGQWTGATPVHIACAQKCVNPATNMPADANSTYAYYTRSSGTSAECAAARMVSTCSSATGLFAPAVAATRFATCTIVVPTPTPTPAPTATPTPVPTATPVPGALINTSDARILTVLDAAVAIGQTDVRLVTQIADGQQYNNFRLRNVPNPGVVHSDGSPWLARVTVPDGSNKPAYIFRMKQGQPLFQGSTLRSELFSGYQDAAVGVREGNDYWMGIEWYFDNDMFDTGGVGQFGPDSISLFDLHGQPGFAGTPASELHGMAFRLNQTRRLTFHTFARAGMDGKIYDLTNGPSTAAIGTNTYDPSGAHGTPNEYVLDNNAQAGVWYRFAVRMKLAATADRAPQLQVYRKKGNGPIVKILDTQAPNTGGGIGSYRYQKSGIYKFDGVFGNKPTRSFYRRGWIIIKNEPGSPTLDQNAIMNWLER